MFRREFRISLFLWKLFGHASHNLPFNTSINCRYCNTWGLVHASSLEARTMQSPKTTSYPPKKHACNQIQIGGSRLVCSKGLAQSLLNSYHAAIDYVYSVEKVNMSFVWDGPKAHHNIYSYWGKWRAGIFSFDVHET